MLNFYEAFIWFGWNLPLTEPNQGKAFYGSACVTATCHAYSNASGSLVKAQNSSD